METLMKTRAVRGAITVERNDKEEILAATEEMLREVLERNEIQTEDLACIIFTLTPDLNDVFPAVAARRMGITDIPLMCMSEIPVAGALPKCVRLMALWNTEKQPKEIVHVYLREAVRLRPDLAEKTKEGKRSNG